MDDPSDPFLQALAAYRAAVLARDVDAFAALYDDEVHVFDMWGAWSLRGIDAWRAMAVDWFASLGDERVVVDAREAGGTRSGDIAVGHAVLTYTALSPEGEKLRSLDNRITLGLRRVDGAWKVFHEHTSAPIEHGSGKAILRYAGGG